MTIGTVLQIPLDQIGELPAELYVGLIDDDAVNCLVARLGVEPLRTPIWVRQNGNKHKSRYSVVAGRHRLRAAKALGWEAIAAEVRADPSTSKEEIRRLQLAENLDRRVLRPIERALGFMHRWWECAGQVPSRPADSQQAQAAQARWAASASVANAVEVDRMTATATGTPLRTLERYRQLHERLVVPFPEQFALINAHPLGQSLRELARLAALKTLDARRQAVEALLSKPDWASMDEVLKAAGLMGNQGWRTDPNNLHAVLEAEFGRLFSKPKAVQEAYLKELPNKLDEESAKRLAIDLQLKWNF